MIVAIPVFMALYCFGQDLPLGGEQTSHWDVLALFIFEAILYQRIGAHIKDTTNKMANKSE